MLIHYPDQPRECINWPYVTKLDSSQCWSLAYICVRRHASISQNRASL